MSFTKLAVPVLTGLMLVSSSVYAQKINPPVMSKAEQPVENSAYEKLLRDAEALIKSGKAAEAYTLLEPLEFDHAGEVKFDHLIGIAALESSQPSKATFAFERVLAVEPDFIGARLDMARAYYQLGDMPRAKTEFSAVLKQNPSATTRDIVQKYLDKIDAPQGGSATRFSAYVEGSFGRDSNVNNATNQAQVFVDLYPTINFTLDPINLQTASSYYGMAAGGNVNHSLNADWRLFAGAGLSKRGNIKHAAFDALGLEEQAGVGYDAEANHLWLGVSAGQYNLGGMHNRNVVGANSEWRYQLNTADQLNVFGQYTKYRFIDVLMQPNDFNQGTMGVGLQHALAGGKSSLFGSVYHGAEKDVGGRTNGGKTFNGFRVGGQAALSEQTNLFAKLGVQSGEFGKAHPQFLRKRTDRQIDLTLAAEQQWSRLWTVRPQLNFSRNNSNIEIYSLKRTDISVTIRRNF
jgi:tetratricopeptide (TPR) repeat protein